MTEPRSKVKKSFDIDKRVVWEAWQQVRVNQGAPGVDEESVAEFERNPEGNLYVIWNRMSSGAYMPPPVKAVQIPKRDGGGVRTLGVPTVADRVAQTVAKLYLEPEVEPVYHPDSYGYRPNRSALDAVGVCRERCWKSDWLIDLDYRSFFDTVDHDLILKAVAAHTEERWVLLYVERWLKAPLDTGDGNLAARDRGTPQGSAISPLLANIYLHYAFDMWMAREFPTIPFERYADDVVAHAKSERQARFALGEIEKRMADCHLELNQEKTRIVYCKDSNRQGFHEHVAFDFLGYTFRHRQARNRRGELFRSFLPAVSDGAAKAIRRTIRRWRIHLWSGTPLTGIAQELNAILRGWVNYYGRFYRPS
jgi:RNA-directed DNA polymerase